MNKNEKLRLILSLPSERSYYLMKYFLKQSSDDVISNMYEFCNSRLWFQKDIDDLDPSTLSMNFVRIQNQPNSKHNPHIISNTNTWNNFANNSTLLEFGDDISSKNNCSSSTPLSKKRKPLINRNSSLLEVEDCHPSPIDESSPRVGNNESKRIDETFAQHLNYSISTVDTLSQSENNFIHEDEKMIPCINLSTPDKKDEENFPEILETSITLDRSAKKEYLNIVKSIHEVSPSPKMQVRAKLLEIAVPSKEGLNNSTARSLFSTNQDINSKKRKSIDQSSPQKRRKIDDSDDENAEVCFVRMNNNISDSNTSEYWSSNHIKQCQYSPRFFEYFSPNQLSLKECQSTIRKLKENPVEEITSVQFEKLKSLWLPFSEKILREVSDRIAMYEVGEDTISSSNISFHKEKLRYEQAQILRQMISTLILQYIQQTSENITFIAKLKRLKDEWHAMNESKKEEADKEWLTLFSQPKVVQLSRFIYYYGPEKGIQEWVRVEKAANCRNGLAFSTLLA